MLSRRWFLKSASATAVLAAVPTAAATAALSVPEPTAVKAVIDPLTAKLFAHRLVVESIQGTYLSKFMGSPSEPLVQIRHGVQEREPSSLRLKLAGAA
jgi:hypothetical protein